MGTHQDSTVNSKSVDQLKVVAPISGRFVNLSDVPDPAFAQKMVGDGAAIDPVEGRLHAPFDAKITMIHPSKHAVSILSKDGIEVLMHIGVDTVKLKGEGFAVKVEEGQEVKIGDLLIEFDMDFVAQHAASLITPILFTDASAVAKFDFTPSSDIETGEPLLTAHFSDNNSANVAIGETIISEPVVIKNVTGIHARPAAFIVKTAKPFAGDIKLISSATEKAINARSVTAIMGLNLGLGDSIYFSSNGADAKDAVEALSAAVNAGLGEKTAAGEGDNTSNKEPSLLFAQNTTDNEYLGISASGGFAVGPLFKVEKEVFDYPQHSANSLGEQEALEQSVTSALNKIESALLGFSADKDASKREILTAHKELLSDPSLNDTTGDLIVSGLSSPAAWQEAINQQVTVLENLANPLMQQRAADLRDVGAQVMRELLGISAKPLDSAPANSILLAEELSPSEVSDIDPSKILAVLTTGGSSSSHAAIIARSQGIPMIAAISPDISSLENGINLLVDADKARVVGSPSQAELDSLEAKRIAASELREKALGAAHKPALTVDGHLVEVAANIGNVDDAALAKKNGAQSIGLLRSEFLFMGRVSAPSEDEQFEAYTTMLKGIGDHEPSIVRTLDVGGDKPLPYVPIGFEENPFLGERGIRIALDRPELLRTQFRALLRASVGHKLRIMLPMISSLRELKLARQVLNEESTKLNIAPVELGVMIEVPSAALMADVLAQEADFFSIGTNDLVQYTMAVDRGNARMASLADNLDPAVLRMIDLTVKGASKHGRWVGVCGGMAAQPSAQAILIGLGVNELSVQTAAVAETKYKVRTLNLSECQALAQEALQCESSEQVKALVSKA